MVDIYDPFPQDPIPPLLSGQRHSAPTYEQRRVRDELLNHFETNPLWGFEGVIGVGRASIAALVRERSHAGKRKLIVKRALTGEGEMTMRREIANFIRLGGTEHITRLIAARDDRVGPSKGSALQQNRMQQFYNTLLGRRTKNAFRGRNNPRRITAELDLKGLMGWPVLVLEYMENGTVRRLINRLEGRQVNAPNRVLWSIFLCLLRGCVAMAYPGYIEQAPQGRNPVLERSPREYGGPEGGLAHFSLNEGKVMFGGQDGRFAEHNLAPVLKFMDLGTARTVAPGEGNWVGSDINKFDVCVIMLRLITKQLDPITNLYVPHGEYRTQAHEIADGGNGAKYGWLDPELRQFICQCMAIYADQRPSLEEMVFVAETATLRKTAESYPFPQRVNETNEAIRFFLQSLIYDAEIVEPTVENGGDRKGKGRAMDEHETPLQKQYYKETGQRSALTISLDQQRYGYSVQHFPSGPQT